MNKIKKACTVALVLILIGGLLFLIAFAASGFSFKSLSGIKHVAKTDSFITEKLEIQLENTDLRIEFSDSATEISTEFYEKQNKKGESLTKITVTKSEDKVKITEKVGAKADLFIWDFESTVAKVIIPSSLKLSLDVKTDNGNVTVIGTAKLAASSFSTDNGEINTEHASISADSLSFCTDNGDIELGKIDTGSLYSRTDNGDVSIGACTAYDKVTVQTDNGEVEIAGNIIANELSVATDNGDIETEKATIDAKKLSFRSDNGDISLKLAGRKTDYAAAINVDNGNSNIMSSNVGERSLEITADNGNVKVIFDNK